VAAIPGIPTTVLVAPDSFKGTLRAGEVAAAIGAGLQAAGAPVDLCPVADGGEGTLEALMSAIGAQAVAAHVTDPLGREIEARFGLTQARRRGRATAIVEVAAASGLGLVAPGERDAVVASTLGTGTRFTLELPAVAGNVNPPTLVPDDDRRADTH
jgi:glycerate kinase